MEHPQDMLFSVIAYDSSYSSDSGSSAHKLLLPLSLEVNKAKSQFVM